MNFERWSWRRAKIVGGVHAVVTLSCTALLATGLPPRPVADSVASSLLPLEFPLLCCIGVWPGVRPLVIAVMLANSAVWALTIEGLICQLDWLLHRSTYPNRMCVIGAICGPIVGFLLGFAAGFFVNLSPPNELGLGVPSSMFELGFILILPVGFLGMLAGAILDFRRQRNGATTGCLYSLLAILLFFGFVVLLGWLVVQAVERRDGPSNARRVAENATTAGR